MIVFNFDAVKTLLPVLLAKAEDSSVHLMFDDGIQAHRVVSFEPHTECFDCNGQFYDEVVGYCMKLVNSTVINFRVCGGELVVA
ncbi:hypothetical protein [Photobacterium sp. J15]|uniref:hypothetical protein n=1 Tax=Photobacterium sp. J15 TaxID=265901 RepID=UPI000B0B229B|nr:hypothetical protein [Photobacterium sp. J15]